MATVFRQDTGELIGYLTEPEGPFPGGITCWPFKAWVHSDGALRSEPEPGTDETTRRAAQWVRENVPTGGPSAPEITGGEVFIGFGAPQKPGASSSATATATPDASSVRPSL